MKPEYLDNRINSGLLARNEEKDKKNRKRDLHTRERLTHMHMVGGTESERKRETYGEK